MSFTPVQDLETGQVAGSTLPLNLPRNKNGDDSETSQCAVAMPYGSTPQYQSPSRIGDAGPVGLVAFGITTVMLNFMNAGITESGSAALVMSYGMFHGGFVQLIAGTFELVKGNTFAAVAFMSYGGFWMGIALLDLLLLTGALPATENQDGKCLWLVLWGIFSFVMFLNTFRLNRALQVVFGTLTLLFFLLAGGQYNTTVLHIAGWVGIFCGFGAIFIGCAEVTNDVHEREVIPLGKMKKK